MVHYGDEDENGVLIETWDEEPGISGPPGVAPGKISTTTLMAMI